MKKVTLPLLVTALGFMQQQAVAQNDSAYINLLRYRATKQSVQSFSITGEQLSRMPYSDLGQAIGVWTGPALATGNNTAFMVDGTLVNDVNIYSIQDVATVTFVQSGPGQIAGLTRAHQYLVLITTKRNTSGKWQWNASGATAFVNRLDSSAKAGLYHQYNLSVSNGTEKLAYGASAGYMHDVFPLGNYGGKEKQNPARQNRYRANAWLDGAIVPNHRFRLDAAFITQRHPDKNSYGFDNGPVTDYDILNKDHALNLKAAVNSSLGAGFSNHIGADFYDVNFHGYATQETFPTYTWIKKTDNHSRNWMAEDRFCFEKHFSGQYLTASVDARYRHIDYSSTTFSMTTNANGTIFMAQQLRQENRAKSLLITPTVAWGINGLLDVQAGAVYSALKSDNGTKHFYPFATASADVLRIISQNTPVSLRLYGAVAAVTDFPELAWVKLANLSKQTDLLDPGIFPLEGANINPYMVYDGSSATRFQGGACLGMLQNRVQIDYSYNKNDISSLQYIYSPGLGSSFLVKNVTPYVRQRAAVSVKTDIGRVNWVSVLSLNWVKSRTEVAASNAGIPSYISVRNSFTTAGFANRVTYRNWFGAADVVAAVNKMYGTKNRNAATLQELHLGRKFRSKAVAFELYAFTRTPFNNTTIPLADLRRYYGLGFTAAF
jgi:hypothetical protein